VPAFWIPWLIARKKAGWLWGFLAFGLAAVIGWLVDFTAASYGLKSLNPGTVVSPLSRVSVEALMRCLFAAGS